MSTEMTTRGYLTAALVPLGEQWKKMRRILTTKVVSQAKHQWFYAKRTEEADHLVRYVYNQIILGGLVNGLIQVIDLTLLPIYTTILRRLTKPTVLTIPTKPSACCIIFACHIIFACRIKKAMKKVVEIVDKYHNPIIEERIRQCRIGFKKEIEDLLDVFITLKDGASNPLLSTNEINAQIRGFTWTAPPNETKIDLSKAEDSLALAKPLIVVTKPRLAEHVYRNL
ncbi:hypothetical protein LWI29_024973 [Acer saccharum]|uniref:Cytochrome P450 n=1 Tax=Acer saccharum TaxID=4024 RepID=A0AA39RT23_ACESA|nr:hypothetical protein LWI29_024973 [Acer saccharum]